VRILDLRSRCILSRGTRSGRPVLALRLAGSAASERARASRKCAAIGCGTGWPGACCRAGGWSGFLARSVSRSVSGFTGGRDQRHPARRQAREASEGTGGHAATRQAIENELWTLPHEGRSRGVAHMWAVRAGRVCACRYRWLPASDQSSTRNVVAIPGPAHLRLLSWRCGFGRTLPRAAVPASRALELRARVGCAGCCSAGVRLQLCLWASPEEFPPL
jgi:hypothetical protein